MSDQTRKVFEAILAHPPGSAHRIARQALDAQPVQVEPVAPNIGDYVLATKYSDGDPGDAWALGFYDGELDMGSDRQAIKVAPRYMVKDGAGNNIRGNGFRRVARIRKDVGRWLLEVASKQLEASPPGVMNLWDMLTPAAFDLEQDNDSAAAAPSRAVQVEPVGYFILDEGVHFQVESWVTGSFPLYAAAPLPKRPRKRRGARDTF